MLRHLRGETTPDEEAALQVWLLQDKAHQHKLNQIEKIWALSLEAANSQKFDVFTAWEKVSSKMATAKISPSTSGISSVWRIAAIFVVIAMVSATVYFSIRSTTPEMTTLSAGASNREVQLPDGSTVWLRAGSQMNYPTNFAKVRREVWLTGEAYFDVKHDAQSPFRVKTNKIAIQVLGTAFLVRAITDSEQVFVVRGMVRISAQNDSLSAITLHSGEHASMIGKEFVRDSVADKNYLSWQNGVLVFDNVSLRSMITELARYFRVDISMSDSLAVKSDSIKVNLKFDNNTLDQVIEEIHLTTGLAIDRKPGQVLVIHQ